MIFGLFTLLVALTISGVAAYYSIAGLCAIFAAAVTPIIIMGAALELGKITATVWLHKYWHRANIQFKLYLIPAIVVLMIITSMGIFGFLSKAHMDQSVTVGDSAAQVQILDEKIKTEKDNIESAKKALAQMDSQVDQMLSRTTDDKGTSKAVTIRKQQASERKSLQNEITAAQKHIAELQNERAPLAAQSRKIEAEVGPVKYIAALIYGDNPDANLLERAVRWVIILLVLVFDPLALVLILAAEQTIEWARTDRNKAKKPEGWHQEWVPDTEAWPEWDGDIPPSTDEQLAAIKQEADVDDDIAMKKFFDEGKELAKSIDSNDGKLPSAVDMWNARIDEKHSDGLLQHHSNPELVNPAEVNLPDDYASTQVYLQQPWVHTPHTENQPVIITRFTNPESNPDVIADIPVLEGEEMWAQRVIDESKTANDLENAINLIAEMQEKLDILQAEHDAKHAELEQIKSVDPVVLTDHLGNPVATYYPTAPAAQVEIPDLSIKSDETEKATNAGFGTEFPKNPSKGDVYLRVDYLPSRLFKWNDKKWIEVDKNVSDRYAYDEEYIKHLVEKLQSGEYSYDLLSITEQDQITRYLNGNTI